MKQVAGTLRLELAQYRELAAFAQFGSDLDKATRRQLARGARLTELLKQAQYQPLPVEFQIVLVFAGTNGFLDDLDLSEIRPFEDGLRTFMEGPGSGVLQDIREKRVLDDPLRTRLRDALTDFKAKFKEEKVA